MGAAEVTGAGRPLRRTAPGRCPPPLSAPNQLTVNNIELFSKKLLTFFLIRIIIVDVSLKETNESHAPLAQLVEQ